MAGLWIEWEKGLVRKPEVLRLARMLDSTPQHAAGCCMMFWEWAEDVTDNGIIPGLTAEDVSFAAGQYEGKDWKEIPCYACDVMSGSGFAIKFDEERVDSAHHDDHGEPVPEDRLPVSVMREVVVGLLKLRPELRDVVAWRFAGMPYRDIALAQGVTQACAESRHRRAMELWPALRALFPRKVAKQAVRAPHRRREV